MAVFPNSKMLTPANYFGYFEMFDTLVNKYINFGISTYMYDMVTKKGLST